MKKDSLFIEHQNLSRLSIEYTGLSRRSLSALHCAGIHSIEQMLKLDIENLKNIPQYSSEIAVEVLNKMRQYSRSNIKGLIIKALEFHKIHWDFMLLSIDCAKLSKRANNALSRAGIHTMGQLMSHNEISLNEIKNIGKKTIAEIMEVIEKFSSDIARTNLQEQVNETQSELLSKHFQISSVEQYLLNNQSFSENLASKNHLNSSNDVQKKEPAITSIRDLFMKTDIMKRIINFSKTHDVQLLDTSLSEDTHEMLLHYNFKKISDIILLNHHDFFEMPLVKIQHINEISIVISEYLSSHAEAIIAYCNGNESALWGTKIIETRIMELFSRDNLQKISLDFIKANLPSEIDPKSFESSLANLVDKEILQQQGNMYYRTLMKFKDCLDSYHKISERDRIIINKRLSGLTLESIGQEFVLTRERVRQITKNFVEKISVYYQTQSRLNHFQEDYYQYLYETYDFDKKELSQFLDIPEYIWNYLDIIVPKRGSKNLQDALQDNTKIDIDLRSKLFRYLHRDKVLVNGHWIKKKRADLEDAVARVLCATEISYDDFFHQYNLYLSSENIPYDNDIYMSDAIYSTRKNRLMDSRYILWKPYERMRYYDIDAQDYTELLDTLKLASYENTETTTLKLFREHPDLMNKYGILDPYELHNLLRKIVEEGSYHDFRCGRMPTLKFGHFNRDEAILEILIENAPISATALADIISEEYGYSPQTIIGSMFKPFSNLNHQGIFYVDHKAMLPESKEKLREALTGDFYYINEIKDLYERIAPNASREEINSYNLKTMGYSVFSRYILTKHKSLDAYFEDLLTHGNYIDTTYYSKRFSHIAMYYQKYWELRKSLKIIELEPNRIIQFSELERAGISLEMIHDFCDAVYKFIDTNSYFSIHSLGQDGFESPLLKFKYTDWVFANLLTSDDRFSYTRVFGTYIFMNGKSPITIKSFILNRVREHKVITFENLVKEMTDRFGCLPQPIYNVTNRVQDTDIFYDEETNTFYSSEEMDILVT